jgi:hypothetical protein
MALVLTSSWRILWEGLERVDVGVPVG